MHESLISDIRSIKTQQNKILRKYANSHFFFFLVQNGAVKIKTKIKHRTCNEYVATSSYDGFVRIWDNKYNLIVSEFASQGSGPVSRVEWDLSGKHIVTYTQETDSTFKNAAIQMWEFDPQKVKNKFLKHQ